MSYLIDQFEDAFNVTKDLHSVRTKGTMQEDIMEEVIEKYNLKPRFNKFTQTDFVGWDEVIYENVDGTIGVYYGTCRMGIPSVKVGIIHNKLWTDDIRKGLREKGLAR